jgi:hypothetical protein
MCESWGDMPDCVTFTQRRARKQHKCCECRRPIMPGEKYEECSGIWDGEPNRYRTCSRCERIRDCHGKAERAAHDGYASYPPFGELLSGVGECAREMGAEYLVPFRKAWRESGVAA